MQGVVVRRAVAKASTKVAKELPRKLIRLYLVPPAVFAPQVVFEATPSTFPTVTAQTFSQTQQVLAVPARKHRFCRRLCIKCASAVASLPAAIVKAAVVFGAQQLTSIASFSGLSGVALGGIAAGVARQGFRRWRTARRSARRRIVSVNIGPAAELSICTFNIRGINDRWQERAPILKQCLKEADADVYCFQEVLTGEFGQDSQLLSPEYQIFECRAALSNLRVASLAGAAFASTVKALLKANWTRGVLVSVPLSVESWRETNVYAGHWTTLLSKVTVAPFFGNSIASRIPAAQTPPPAAAAAAAAAATNKSASKPGSSSSTGSSGWWPWQSRSSSLSSPSSSSSSNSADTLVLGDYRAAQRVCFQLQLHSPVTNSLPNHHQQQQQQQQQDLDPDPAAATSNGSSSNSRNQAVYVWLVNTHLDHSHHDIRSRQMVAILDWMDPLKSNSAAVVITGDLNAPPEEDTHQMLVKRGYCSTFRMAHGTEPSYTWPSGIQAPLMDADEPPYCADYIYAWQNPKYELQVTRADLCGDKPMPNDKTLYPSDHFGIKANLRVMARSSGSSSQQQQQQR